MYRIMLLTLAMLLVISIPITALATQQADLTIGKLSIYISPPVIIADGKEHACIVIQLLDAYGNPMPAEEDVKVFLTSSNLEVGSVEEEVTIRAGEYYAVAKFKTTLIPGETKITAVAYNFLPTSAILRTFNPMVSANPPNKLLVYALPNLMPTIAGSEGRIVVQIVDSMNMPVIATHSIVITLFSSNTTVLQVPQTLIISAGSSYGYVNFKVVGHSGRATVNALSDGFYPGNATVTVSRIGDVPAKLALTLAPSTLMADGLVHNCIFVQLLDRKGLPTKADKPIKVYISSSDPHIVDIVDREVIIGVGSYYATARVKTNFLPGISIVTAAAQDLEASIAILNVKGHVPSKLAIYASPTMILADRYSKSLVTVQLQSLNGEPVISIRDIPIRLTISPQAAGSIQSDAMIKTGENYVTLEFLSTHIPSDVTITAIAQGLEVSTTRIQTTLLPLTLTIIAPSIAEINQTYEVKLLAQSLGRPVKDVSIIWDVKGGEIVSKVDQTDDQGIASIIVRQISQRLTIAASASKLGYSSAFTSKTVEVPRQPIEVVEPTINLLGIQMPLSTLVFIGAIIITIMLIIYIVLKRGLRKGSMVELKQEVT